jgi:peptide/nickel transport system permease protein
LEPPQREAEVLPEIPATTASEQIRRVFHSLKRDPLALFASVLILSFIFIAIFAPWISPYPAQGRGIASLQFQFLPPSSLHPFGTDDLGRDILSRVFFGASISLLVAFSVVTISLIIGVPLGIVAGYYGGWIDETIMRVTDIFLSFPSLLLSLIIVATLGANLSNLIIAISVTWWPWYTRIERAQAVALRGQYFVLSAKGIGVSNPLIIFRHILPNAWGPIMVQATLDLGGVIITAAGLSFLGLGIQPPSADWGLMISEGRNFFLQYWWIATFPGLAILLASISFNIIGDSLREIIDPRLRTRGIIR